MRRPVSGKCCKPAVPEPDILNLNELRIPNHHAVEPQLNVLGARAAPFDDGPSVHLAAKIIKDVSVPGCWHVNFRERAKVDLCDKAERLFQRAPDHYGARLEARSGAVDLSPDEQGPIRRAAPAQGALRRAEIKPVERLCVTVFVEQPDLHLLRSAICLRLMDGSAQRYAGGDDLLLPPIDRLRGRVVGVCEHKLTVRPAHSHQREMQKRKHDQTSHGKAPENCRIARFTCVGRSPRPPASAAIARVSSILNGAEWYRS